MWEQTAVLFSYILLHHLPEETKGNQKKKKCKSRSDFIRAEFGTGSLPDKKQESEAP
jgi:hypothetical protein